MQIGRSDQAPVIGKAQATWVTQETIKGIRGDKGLLIRRASWLTSYLLQCYDGDRSNLRNDGGSGYGSRKSRPSGPALLFLRPVLPGAIQGRPGTGIAATTGEFRQADHHKTTPSDDAACTGCDGAFGNRSCVRDDRAAGHSSRLLRVSREDLLLLCDELPDQVSR